MKTTTKTATSRLSKFLTFAAITLAFVSPIACAGGPASISAVEQWQSKQKLVLSSIKVDIEANKEVPAQHFWVLLERTPSGRIRMIMKDSPRGATKMTFLIQDNTCMGLIGDDVASVAAPWMMGQYVFGQTMEPEMLLNWVMGIPGKNFQKGAAEAIVSETDGGLEIEQAGWRVNYTSWNKSNEGMSVPKTVQIKGENVSINIEIEALEGYSTPPDKYKEFKIM